MAILYYLIHDCGDGSAGVNFFKDEQTLALAIKVQEKEDEIFGGFAEVCSGSINTEVDDHCTTIEELEERLKELKEED